MRIKSMLASFTVVALLAAPLAAAAQSSPVGRWKTIDDETGKVKSIVEISKAADGTLQGKVDKVLQSDHGPNPTCDKCDGANKGKPIEGMTILWGLQADGDEWTGGTVLDPSKGKTYKAKLEMLGDDRLGVAGCIAFFCRQQEWVRE